jgi:hypothetical protein
MKQDLDPFVWDPQPLGRSALFPPDSILVLNKGITPSVFGIENQTCQDVLQHAYFPPLCTIHPLSSPFQPV